jgi:cell division protein FtsB
LYFCAVDRILDLTSMPDTPFTQSSRRQPATHSARLRRVVQSVLWVGAALLLLEALFGDRGFTAMIEARKQHQVAEAALETLRAENAMLRGQAKRLKEDPSAIEEIARRDLHLIAPGEVVFIVKDAKPAQ